MKSCRWVTLLACMLFAMPSVHAAVVSIRIMQHDKASDSVWDSSLLFEQSVMDSFFESGDIVTNDPVSATKNGETDAEICRKSLGSATDDGIDFFISIAIEYDTADSSNPQGILLSHIQYVTWEGFSVADSRMITEGRLVPETVTTDNDNEDGIKSFAAKVGRLIRSELNRH
jgi:hypothetical protein